MNLKDNGFAIVYGSGSKIYVASEGAFGRKMMEDMEFRNFAFENAEPLEIKLETKNLTSMLKGQYGRKRRVETPSSTKRQNYRGIGQAKSSKPQAKPREEEAPTTSRASSTSSTYLHLHVVTKGKVNGFHK